MMASFGRKQGVAMFSNLLKTLTARPSVPNFPSGSRGVSGAAGIVSSEVLTSHTAKWMQDTGKKSPMELINEVPPIKVEGRIVACEGDSDPALGHPIEFICLDLDAPAVCKYCGLRYFQDHGHHH
nr:NADH dehydrogenase [ubiquinone] iron-sulfur protein 6, mitochondrial [Ipomoea trifida]GMD02402.1 NADH dehydrogenase [ubiquinone] iron-sulfur protein 6, mitochondrial [Ipomoea batatas]